MDYKALHRWVGLLVGALLLVLASTGTLLALDPVLQAWQAHPADKTLSVATLAQRAVQRVPGLEEIRRLPSGATVVFGFDGAQAQALTIDPASAQVLAPYQPSVLPRWVKNLHRALLWGDTGRWGTAGAALALLLLCVSGLLLLRRRLGGWRHVAGRVRGTLVQRLHVVTGRALLLVLCLTALTGLVLSASTLGLWPLEEGTEPEVVSVPTGQAALPLAQLHVLQGVRVQDLRSLSFPDPADPQDTWKLVTRQGEGWIDRYTGQWLAWRDASAMQQLNDWALVLHTGEAAWPWAVVLGLSGVGVLLLGFSGLQMWWQARRSTLRMPDNSPWAQAQVLIFVASEGGSTWGFAQALHAAWVQQGQRVRSAPLEQFQVTAATRHVFILAATYGDGQAPTHARQALERVMAHSVAAVPVTVLGFGDRQYPGFCAYAQALEQALRARHWPAALPLECIHQQSVQEFERWGQALGQSLGQPLALHYVPYVPSTTALTLVARQVYPGHAGQNTAILRFTWPAQGLWARCTGQGLGHFAAGDLVGIVPPGSSVPRYYSLASGVQDGFVELCVRQMPGGLCSGYLLGLAPGASIQAFVRPNPGFALGRTQRSVVLIGAGTGVAPLAGFIRRNDRRTPLFLYFGGRDPAHDDYFGPEMARWHQQGRLAGITKVFSRIPQGGGYVQDALRRDARRLRSLLADGALVRVCGSRAMAQDVARTLDAVLAPLHLSVQQLKTQERYAEDTF